MIDFHHTLPIVRQCALLGVARSTAYYRPQPLSERDLALMRRIDAIHLARPFLGSRRIVDAENRWKTGVRKTGVRLAFIRSMK